MICPKRAGAEHSVSFVEEEGGRSVNSQRNLFKSFALNVGRWLGCLCAQLGARISVAKLFCSVILLKHYWSPSSYSLVPLTRRDLSQMRAGNRSSEVCSCSGGRKGVGRGKWEKRRSEERREQAIFRDSSQIKSALHFRAVEEVSA